MQHRKWISAIELNRWADTTEAKVRLPELLRRLVHATIEKQDLESIDFPGGEEVHRPGFDGKTQTKKGNAWVPEGLACWELGTDRAARNKLNEDFEKRSKEAGKNLAATVYIGVTPHDFQKKSEWVEAKNKLGVWRDVRVYDSSDLEQWLEEAPGVALWLAGLMSKTVAGLSDISSHWENLLASLKYKLSPKVLLVSRKPSVDQIQGWLSQPPAVIAIRSESPQEVVDFFAAWVASLSIEDQTIIASRAVIVNQPEAWHELANSEHRLIMLRAEQLELSQEALAEAKRKGHHVLTPLPWLSPGMEQAYKLERINRYELEEALRDAGLSEKDVHLYAQHSGGSFSILKRQMSKVPIIKVPKWATAEMATELAPLLLVGAWRDSTPTDQFIVEKVSGRTYQQVLAIVNRWRTEVDAPVRWGNGDWEFVSPQDAWAFLAKAITPAHLTAFEEMAITVLATDDPRFDLVPGDRWMASVRGKTRPHSDALRRGLAQTLALLSTRDASEQVTDTIPLQARVNRAVTTILTKEVSWRRWASLDHLLSILAEAAPMSFLDAVEADLSSAEPELPKLFGEEGDSFTGRAEHIGLLWALERLAWCPDYLTRVAIILAKLAEHDPGGKIANRPDASLRDTLCPWMPFTTASVDQRIIVVDVLLQRYAKVGWQLLLKLLPQQMSSISNRSLPEWREWAERWKRGVTQAEFVQVSIAYMKMAIAACEKDPGKWLDVINHFANFPQAEIESAMLSMEKAAGSGLPDDLMLKIWLGLYDHIKRHRYFSNANWAMQSVVLDRLENIAAKFQPSDPVERALPLFKHGWDHFVDQSLPWSEQEKSIQKSRADCIRTLIEGQGLNAVKRLASLAGEPFAVGVALAESCKDKYDKDILPSLLRCGDKALEEFALGYARQRESWPLIESLPLKEWKADEAAALMIMAPRERKTWNFVETLGESVSSGYWKIVPHYFQGNPEDTEYIVRRLISVGRAASAMEVLGIAVTRHAEIPAQLLLDLFELALTALPADSSRPAHAEWIDDIFAYLQTAEGLDESKLATLEWLLLPAIRGNHSPVNLQRILARDPEFFVDMLALHFRPRHQDKSTNVELDEERKGKAQRAAILLSDWKRLPGTGKDGSIDGTAFSNWVRAARKKAAAEDRIEVCDSILGKVFAYSPTEVDGSWPCIPVREILEEAASSDLEEGLGTGIINKRGIYTKSPDEGGRQELALAAQYEAYALQSQARWPRTAAALGRIVADYKDQARREDLRVEAER